MFFLLYLIVILNSAAASSNDDLLISEFSRRERVDTMLIFHCNSTQVINLLRKISPNLTGPVQSFDVNSDLFFEDHQRFMAAKHYRLGVIADLGCPRTVALIEFCSDQSYFNGSYRWLIFSRETLQSTLEVLEMQNLNVDTRLTLALLSVKSPNLVYDLYEVYGTIHRRADSVRVSHVGRWDSYLGLNLTSNFSSYSNRKDLGGVQLWSIISTLNAPRNVTLEEHLQSMISPKEYSTDRYGYRLTELLGYHHNFRLKLVLAKGWSLELAGTNSTSGSGIIGQLRQNVVDMSSTPLSIQFERMDSYDHTVPVALGEVATVFRHPKSGLHKNNFLKPFNELLWLAIVGVLVTASIVLLLTFLYDRETRAISNGQFLLAIFAFFCQQGHSLLTVIGASRITVISLVWFSFLIYQFYCTFIIGFLLVLPPKTIRTLDQLLASDLKYSIENHSYNRDFFRRTKNATALQLYAQKILPNKFGFVNVSSGIALVKGGGYAFHCDTSYGNSWITETLDDHEICELQEMLLFPLRPLHVILPKRSPLRDLFRISLRRMLETGVAQYYRRKYYIDKPKCIRSNLVLVKVGFRDIVSLYKFLAWSGSAAFLVLLLENVVFYVKQYFELIKFNEMRFK